MTQATPRRPRVTRRTFLTWSGIGPIGLGVVAGGAALLACQQAVPRGPSGQSTPSNPAIPATPVSTSVLAPTAQPPATTAVVSPSPTAATVAAADSLAKLNYLHTDGAKIVDNAGQEVLLAGVNWFGMETDTLAPHGIWARNYKDMLDQVVQLGYNCIRLPFSNELFDPALTPNGIDVYQNPDLKGLTGLEIMDRVVVEAGKRGLKIILDQHRPTTDSQSDLWYTVELSAEDWQTHWTTLAQRYLGNDTVIGADLHNEPCGDATWGSGDSPTDWPAAAESCANAIHAVNPHWLIFVEGIEKVVDNFGNVFDWTWQGGELINARARPLKLKVPNQVVYSAHDYGPDLYDQGWFQDVKFPDNLPGFWDFHWGFLAKQGTAPVLVGEFGGTSVGTDREGQWQRTLLSYLKANKIHYTYWALNANSADTGGLLAPDWKSVNQDKQALLKTYQGNLLGNKAPEVVNTSATPKPSATRLKLKALHFDATQKQWTNALKPEVYISNKTLEPLDLSKFELRYWFAPNGNASPKTHQVQITGTSTENFGQVLTGGQAHAEIVAPEGQTFGGNPLMYVRVTFAPGVTAPKRDSAGLGLAIQRMDGGQYFQPSHYSYRDYHWPSEWTRIGLYQDGKLVWGVEPQTYEATQAAKDRAVAAQRAKFMSG